MNERKYRVQELLHQLPFNEVRMAKKFLINQLKITERTFDRYCSTNKDEHYQIPGDHLLQLSAFFDIDPKEMYVEQLPSLYLRWVKHLNDNKSKLDV